jgi:NADH-quinone oxidoreductase subunit E
VCDGTACHVKGAPHLLTAVADEYGVAPGETTGDGQLTLEIVYCIGSCALAPVTVMDGQVVGRVKEDDLLRRVKRQVVA